MFEPRILNRSRDRLSKMTVAISCQQWTATAEYDVLVDSAWQARAKQGLWDGTYYRVLDTAALEHNALSLGTIRYRYIATFRELHGDHARLELDALNHLSTVALLRTSDGQYTFGRRASNHAIELIGGGVQQDELPVSAGADLEENLYKEIREEAGIMRDDVSELTGLGAVLSSTSNVLLICHALLRISKAEAANRFGLRSDNEMSEPILVPAANLPRFLRDLPDYRALIPDLL